MDRSTLLNHVKGMFFGGAIGDALGYPAEFDHKVDPRQRKYNDLLLNKDDIALVTDDTLMTMAVARGLIRAFEEELAAACGRRHAIAVSSGTAALHLMLLAVYGPAGPAPMTRRSQCRKPLSYSSGSSSRVSAPSPAARRMIGS